MSCELCLTFKGAQLTNHYQNKHANFEFTYKKDGKETMTTISRNHESNLSCPFVCSLSYETRRGQEKHLAKANSSCIRPKYGECFVSAIKDTPVTQEVETPSLRSYNDSIVMAVSGDQRTTKEMQMIARMVRALDIEPFGMYLSSGREINAVACKEVVDCLVNEYDGQQVYFSTKEDIEYAQEEPLQSNKMQKSNFHADIQFSSRVLTGPFSFLFLGGIAIAGVIIRQTKYTRSLYKSNNEIIQI